VTAGRPPSGRALAPWRERLDELHALDPPVLVACSGGPDSLALLALAVDAALLPVAVHVDHGLRPESRHEAALVASLAERVGAPFRSAMVTVGPGPNLEARAREARYAALEEVRAELGAGAVLLGHTADDQAETVLLNLLRGGATAGLGGMPPRRGRIVRPLLALRRADTAEICARLGLVPLRDPMNDDPAFRRVWLRREVIPALERAGGRDLTPVLARQAGVLRAESNLLDELAGDAWPLGGRARARELAALDPALARRAVRRWLGPPPPSLDEVDAVLAVARHERAAVDLAGGRRVARRAGELRVEASARSPRHAVLVPLPGSASGAGLQLESWVEREAPVRWPDGRWACVVDADVAGRQGILLRSPRTRRCVLRSLATGEPIWDVGYRVAGGARVAPRTRRFLWISAERRRARTSGTPERSDP
jgi:tRNA(Ile)-lysidine synthase